MPWPVRLSSWHWMLFFIGSSTALYVLAGKELLWIPISIGLLLVGLPHGSTDWSWLKKRSKNKIHFYFYIILYLLGVIAAYGLYYFQSTVFWSFFFIASFLHFYWIEQSCRTRDRIFAPDLAFASIFILPLIQSEDYREIMKTLHSESFAELHLSLEYYLWPIFIALFIWRMKTCPFRLEHIFLLGLFGLCFWLLPLWISFFAYFLCIHSLRHLRLNLEIEPKTAVHYFWSELLVVSILALILILSFYWAYPNALVSLLIGLVVLSIPHLVLERLDPHRR